MRALGCLLFTLCVGLSAARSDDKLDSLRAFQGPWRLAGARDGGKEVAVPGNGLKIAFKGDRVFINGEPKLTIKVDPTCNPKIIDLALIDEKDRVIEGIYRFQGATLTICLHDPAGTRMRPLSFREEGTKVFILEKPKGD